MPFVSDSQRSYLHSQKPEMAKEWEAKTPPGKELPEKVGKFKAPLRMIGKADETFKLPMIAVNFSEKPGKKMKHTLGCKEPMAAKYKDGGGPQQYGEQSMPDYASIYGIEEGLRKISKEQQQQLTLRRRADGARMIHTFGFHGEAPEPQVTWDPKSNRHANYVEVNKPKARGLTNQKENNRMQVRRLTIKRTEGSYIPPSKRKFDERTP